METMTKTAIMETLQTRYAGMFNFPEYISDDHPLNKNIVTFCPIHGRIEVSLRSALAGVSLICPACGPFKSVLVRKYGTEILGDELSRLYRFAYRDHLSIINQSKLISRYDKAIAVYTRFQKETPGYVTPKLIDRGTKWSPRISTVRNRTPKQAEADLRKIFGDSFDYPHIESEYVHSRSHITVICPVHGASSIAFNSMYNKKTGCCKCKNYRALLKRRYGAELGFIKLLEYYAALRNRIVSNDQVIGPPASELSLTQENNPITESKLEDNAMAVTCVNSNTLPANTIGAIVDELILNFNTLNVNNISRVEIGLDIKTSTETILMVLDDGSKISITRPQVI